MNRLEITRFFRLLSRKFSEPCEILLTGAGAGSVYGYIRATQDIDFEVRFKARSERKKRKLWEGFSNATQQVSRQTAIAVQYSEDIDHGSSITLHDYRKHAKRFKRFGTIEVKLLSVPYWCIGKFSRYLEPDIRDLIAVLKKTKTPEEILLKVLGTALKKSPKSTACFSFRRQVEHFLLTHGARVWGRGFAVAAAVAQFHRFANIRTPNATS